MYKLTQKAVSDMIAECCEKNHLSYNNLNPAQVSPGVWRFKAVEMDYSCSKYGHCRQMTYFARQVGNEMILC